jgi:hypothetical protein
MAPLINLIETGVQGCVFALSLGRAANHRQQEPRLPSRGEGGHRREHSGSDNSDSDNDVDPVRFGHLIGSNMARMSALIASSFRSESGLLGSVSMM